MKYARPRNPNGRPPKLHAEDVQWLRELFARKPTRKGRIPVPMKLLQRRFKVHPTTIYDAAKSRNAYSKFPKTGIKND